MFIRLLPIGLLGLFLVCSTSQFALASQSVKEVRETLSSGNQSHADLAKKAWVKKCGEWLNARKKGATGIEVLILKCGAPTCAGFECSSKALYRYRTNPIATSLPVPKLAAKKKE